MDPERAARIEANVDLVRKVAASLLRLLPMYSLDDLVSAGHEGLVDAALRYDPEQGATFATFAYRRIRGAMIDAVRRESRATRAHRRAAQRLDVAQAVLDAAAEHPVDRRAPLEARVAAVRATVERAAVAMALVGVSGSEEDADAEAPDPAPAHPDEIIDRAELRRRLVESLGKLPPEERAIIDAVYFEGEPMSDYADRVGVHKSTICRRHARAITRLATTIGSPPRRRGPPPSGG